MIGDILFTLAAIGFTYSAVPQILKLHRVKNSLSVSYQRHKIILACVIVSIAACIYTELWLSTAMNTVQLACVLILMYQIKKYRR